MSLEVENLIIQPFRELINRGNEAIANAEAARSENPELSQSMLRSARAVVREGDRALQKVQPLVLGHLERYGDAFRDAIKECDELFESQRQLEEVLYDIDDFLEVETFDAARLAQLQAASKAFALDTIESIRRLRIDDIPRSPTSFPPLPPLPRPRAGRVEPLMISRPGTRTGRYVDPSLISPQAMSAPTLGYHRRTQSATVRSNPAEAMMLRRMSTKKSQKSLTPSTSSSDSHYSQASFQWSAPGESDSRGGHSQQPSDVEVLGDEIQNLLSEPSSPKFPETQNQNRATVSAVSTPWTSAWVHDQLSSSRDIMSQETIPEDAPTGRPSEESRGSAASKRYTVESDTLADVVFAPVNHSSRGRRVSMFSSVNSQLAHMKTAIDTASNNAMMTSSAAPVPESAERQSFDTQSQTLVSGGSIHESATGSPLAQEVLPEDVPSNRNTTTATVSFAEPRTVPKPIIPKVKAKPCPQEEQHPKPVWYSREENCSIGSESTLFLLKNFCSGSLTFKNDRFQEATRTAVFIDTAVANSGGAYQDSMTSMALALGPEKPISFGARKTVTQCIDCQYAHSAADFRRDMARDRRANATAEGVNYRLRFLYKSHLAVDTRESTLYGCLFCAHLGYTSREGDATVFTSERQLFRHLSHHPQPLPQISGLTVLYGYLGSNCTEAEDYDLHFPSPQFASPIIPEAPLLTKRPTAVAIQNQLQKEGGRALTDPDGRKTVLQFLTGARIVGVEFPDAWGGKWCTGWHDGVRGTFPAKLVTLEAPPKSEIRLPGTNNDGVVVVSRWKWEPRDVSAGWLAFEKNTIITNVSWLSYDSWCWSGTTRDGRSGFFPSSHIKADSIRDPSGIHGSSLQKKESRRLFKMKSSRSG